MSPSKKKPKKTKVPARQGTTQPQEQVLFARVVDIIQASRQHVARSVNTAMVQAYWLIGQAIVEVEQHGEARATYGDELIARLAKHLRDEVGKGFGARTLRRIRQFYLTYPEGSALPPELRGPEIRTALLSKSGSGEIRSAPLTKSMRGRAAAFPPTLSWTHYLILLKVTNPAARSFYEIEAAREGWSSRQLERQVASLLFERLSNSRDKEKVLELARRGHELDGPSDVLKNPFVLEFLGLHERDEWRERELEQAIIDRLEAFLLELGKGFCFVARQKRLTLEGDHFFVDLVFYNRLLRAFVLVDLKLGKLTHQDLGQMQMYVNYYDRYQRAEHEAKTIGIVLCSEKNDAMARITLPEDDHQIHASRYQLYLPTEEELREEIEREREEAERTIRLAGSESGGGEG